MQNIDTPMSFNVNMKNDFSLDYKHSVIKAYFVFCTVMVSEDMLSNFVWMSPRVSFLKEA